MIKVTQFFTLYRMIYGSIMSLDWVMLNLETLLNLEKKFKVQQIFLDHQMRHFETYRLICAKWDYDEN
jgi:hypothetical protein